MNKEKIKTNYKRWAFRLLIYVVLFNLAIGYLVINYAHGFHDEEIFSRNVLIFSIITSLLLVTGIVLTILSIKNKEEKDYKYYSSIIGFSILILMRLLSFFL